MALTIFGRRTSGNVMPILWACDEMGVRYEQVDIGGPFGGNDTPEYLARNPNGLVPTIEHDGFVLWESNSILRYLCGRYADGLLSPSGSAGRARAEQWMDWRLTTVMPMMTPIFWGRVRTPEAERNEAAISAAIARGVEVWGLLNGELGQRDWVAGHDFSMADLSLGPQIHRWLNLVSDYERPAMPYLEAWYGRLTEREKYQEHVMIPMV